jgi:hypothetical protein
LVVVDLRNDALLVEHGEGIVYLLQSAFYFRLQVIIILIGDVIGGAKDGTRGLLIWNAALLTDDEHSAYDEQH